MDLAQLENLVAVVEERSFSRAAQRLNRTQPAVSQMLKKLEQELGETVLDRSSREGVLTDAGVVLYNYAKRLLNLRGEAVQAVDELRHLHKGKLSIAGNEFAALYLVGVLDEFRRAYPRVRIAVQRSLASRISDAVLSHSAELGVLSFRPENTGLRSVVVYQDRLAFVVHAGHPLAAKGRATIRQLAGETFVAHNVASPYRARVIDAFAKHRTSLNMDVQLPTIEAIKRFVSLGNGVALIPRIAAQPDIDSGRLVEVAVRELSFTRQLRIVYRKQSPLSHAARAFLATLKNKAAAGGGYLWQRD